MMEWTRGQIIGQGSSATVYLATTTSSAAVSAVKSSELSQSQHLQREQKILSTLSSPHIVSYRGFNITRENNSNDKNDLMYNLFMEYMPLGTLSQATRRNGGRLSEQVIAQYTWQVLKGLEYLHSRGLVHCDIKGSNILVGGKSGSVVKIADFGFCKSVNDDSTAVAGTPAFMSPEAARGEEQGCACDVWGVGCTVIEMANGGCSPWPNAVDPVTVLYRVGYCGDVPEIPRFLSDEAKDFLGKCFLRNPRERWSATQLLMHPFLVGFMNSSSSFNSKGYGDDGGVVLDVESNSCSPTSILEHGFWNSVEESQCPLFGDLVQGKIEDSASDRIRKLSLCSGVPSWNLDDQNWITTRWNNETEIEGPSSSIGEGSMAASNSITDDYWGDLDELQTSYVSDVCNFTISSNFCGDFIKCRDFSVVASSNLNFERHVAEMQFPLTLDIL